MRYRRISLDSETDKAFRYILRKYSEVLKELARYERNEKRDEKLSSKTSLGESSLQTKNNSKQKEKGE